MPTLEELRKKFQEAPEVPVPVPGPKPKRDWPVSAGERRSMSGKRAYTVAVDGRDAILHFGKAKGKKVSDVAKEESDYLRWMLSEAINPSKKNADDLESLIDDDLIDIIRFQLKLVNQK